MLTKPADRPTSGKNRLFPCALAENIPPNHIQSTQGALTSLVSPVAYSGIPTEVQRQRFNLNMSNISPSLTSDADHQSILGEFLRTNPDLLVWINYSTVMHAHNQPIAVTVCHRSYDQTTDSVRRIQEPTLRREHDKAFTQYTNPTYCLRTKCGAVMPMINSADWKIANNLPVQWCSDRTDKS